MKKWGYSGLCNSSCRARDLIALVLFAIVLNADADPLHSFDIPAQMAPGALNMLAQQANVPLLFPYDQVVGIRTRELVGEYELAVAVLRLLDGTRLTGKLNERGVLVIEFREVDLELSESHGKINSKEGISTSDEQRKPWLGRIATAFVDALIGAPASAAEEAENETLIEEIVVTATYRDTRLMDTPITISAVTDRDIVDKGIEDIKELYKAIPGLNYMIATTSYNQITMRGIVPIDGGPSPVGTYIDMVPVGSSRGALGHTLGTMFDMERVEVLKGPQGTLYGEGALGGVIRYITKQPDPSGFDYAFRASLETMDHSSGVGHRVDAMLNVPLGEQVAARLVLYSRDKKGLIDALGLRNEKDVDWTEETGARLKVMVQPTDDFILTGMADIYRMDVGGPGSAFHCYEVPRADIGIAEVPFYPSPNVNCNGDHNAQLGRDPYQTSLTHPNHPNEGFTDSDVYNLAAEWALPFATLIASASYFESDWHFDEEAPPAVAFLKDLVEGANCFGMLPDGYCNGGGPDNLVDNRYSTQGAWGLRFNTTEREAYELRLVSNRDSRLQWTLGAYAKESDNGGGNHGKCPEGVPYRDLVEHCALLWLFHPDTPVDVQGAVADWLNTVIFPGNRSHVVNKEESVFGELTYRISDQWEITVGARTVDVGIDHEVLEPGVNPTNAVLDSFRETNAETSPKLAVMWRPADDWMVYGIWSHGFRPGVVNTRLISVLSELEPLRAIDPRAEELYQQLFDQQVTEGDEAFNYELGVKATVADGRLTFTSSVYFIDWESVIINTAAMTPDIQGLVPFPLQFADNIGAAESQGLELELQGQLTDSLRWTFGGNWMWKSRVGAESAGNTLVVADAGVVDVKKGNRMPSSPRTSGYGSLVYDFQLAGFDASARTDIYWVASQWWQANNERVTPGHETVDLKLTLSRDDYRLSFYVRNATDELILHTRSNVGYQIGRARSFGIELNYGL